METERRTDILVHRQQKKRFSHNKFLFFISCLMKMGREKYGVSRKITGKFSSPTFQAVLACVAASALGAWNGPLAGGQPAHQYPAGVDPHACPNYPNCANPAVAVAQTHAAAWNGAPAHNQWNAAPAHNQWNAAPQPQWNAGQSNGQWNQHSNDGSDGQYTGDGDYRGEGLAESGAYGDHPSWNNGGNHAAPAPQWNAQPHNNAAWAAAPGNNNPLWAVQGGHHAAAHSAPVPAGVDPHSCPNYPYCH